MRVDSATLIGNISQSLQRQKAAAEEGATDPQAVREGLRVSLSALAQTRSASEQKNRDIEDSDLPRTIKDILKMIRELKAQVAAKQAELDAVMTDQSLDADTRRLKAEALQSELASLSGALAGANASLLKAVQEQGLDAAQMQTAATLAMR